MVDEPVCVLKSPDRTVEVELFLETKAVSLKYTNDALPAKLVFETKLSPSAALDAVWPGLKNAALHGAQADPDKRVHLQWVGSRATVPLRQMSQRLRTVAQWLVTSGETTNHTYELSGLSKTYLAHTVAAVTGATPAAIAAFIAEAESDTALAQHVRAAQSALPPERRALGDFAARFGRRLGWYAVVRALKPALVVETGVDKGLGAVLLSAALLRNRAEGRPGRYIGTDNNPNAGYLLGGPYAEVGHVAFGDSLETLGKLAEPIGIFINDSDHAAGYETREYDAVRDKLAAGAVVLSDNAVSTPALAEFAEATGRRFLFWRETPAEHWYGGGGIGFAFGAV